MHVNQKAVEWAKEKGNQTVLDCGGRQDQIPHEML